MMACREQLRLFHSTKSLKVDTIYRQLRGKNINEVVFTAYAPSYEKGNYIQCY